MKGAFLGYFGGSFSYFLQILFSRQQFLGLLFTKNKGLPNFG
jgi:hypothetical protein